MAFSFFNRNKNNNKSEMAFVDHLEALRWHVVRSLLAIIILAIVVYINIDWIFDHIVTGPVQKDFVTYTWLCNLSHQLHAGDALCIPPININMQTTAYGGQFISSFTIAFVMAFIIAFPYIFWEFWRFIRPALNPKEIKNTRGSIFWVSFFFFCGAAFGYFLLAPFTFSFLANFTLGTHTIVETRPTLTDYIDNLVDIILGTGIAFELPVASFVLTKIGILTPTFLKKYRKYAYIIILVVAAVITPSPDWMSQTIVFIPLMVLYEISIAISRHIYKKEDEATKEWS